MIIILSLFPHVMSSARGPILQFLSAAIIEYYIIWNQKKGWSKNFSWKFIRIGLICVVIGIPAFYYSTAIFGRNPSMDFIDYVSEYVGSSIVLFNEYINSPVKRPVVFGEESLIGIHQLLAKLGVSTYVRNVNLEPMKYYGNVASNVYTFFRRPLHDFGLLGMYFFTILVTALFSWIYYNKIKYNKNQKRIEIWIFSYGYLYYWILVSSILQYSEFYISHTTILYITIMIIGFNIMTRVKISIKKK